MVTTDNASTNAAMLSILKKLLNDYRILLHSDDCPNPCLAHVFYFNINDLCITARTHNEFVGLLFDIAKYSGNSPKLLVILQQIYSDHK